MTETVSMIRLLAYFIFFLPLLGSAQVTIQPKDALQSEKHTLKWQDRSRSYLLYTPPGVSNLDTLPVVFAIHGGGGTAKGLERITKRRFNELAYEQKFLLVYPNAVSKTWNSGRLEILKPRNKDVDDVGFLLAILEELKAEFNVDESKVFATGISNGGFMTNRLLCERPDVFKAGAVVTASMAEDFMADCNPDQPVSLMVINGLDDPLVPYNGGDIRLFKKGKSRGRVISTDDYIKFWMEQNNCDVSTRKDSLINTIKDDGTRVLRASYGGCDAEEEVVLISIEGGGHTWPGGRQYLGERWIGKTSREIVACDVIWEFFMEVSD